MDLNTVVDWQDYKQANYSEAPHKDGKMHLNHNRISLINCWI